MDAPSQNMIQHKYGRDYLLQLRLHPFSLQKPDNLKNHDIVKEKAPWLKQCCSFSEETWNCRNQRSDHVYVHGDCPFQKKITTDRNKTMTIQESGMKLEDELKVNIKLLREKIYSVKQEQQKMAILQSFLHFKKHQLDEGYRRMDDKKIEIANWECSLANRAKRLLEKECRLEAKRLNLLDKESKLDEREKMLNENRKCTETKFQQDNETVEEIVEEINSESKMKYPEKTFSVDYEFGDTPEVKI
ncbi:hypothetical protein HNY73_020468 [Argiope bruennichi]|uniref:Uncharacterized protein n=1 Tax=Argiope bruennichi TaxID=94029 RepID=A0A8T0E804_ARGBR|nr:hypothetical protein HNY73_020468 [Argiope bruennichi]